MAAVSNLSLQSHLGGGPLRRLFLAVVVVLVVVPCGTALASSRFHSAYHLKLSTKKADASSGFDISASFSDSAAPNKAPKILTGLKIKLPAGSRFDLSKHPACRSTLKPLENKGLVGVCPARSKYGSGEAKVILGSTPFAFPVHSYILDPVGFDGGRREIEFDVVLNPKSSNPLGFFFGPRISGSNLNVGLPDDAKFNHRTTRGIDNPIYVPVQPALEGEHHCFLHRSQQADQNDHAALPQLRR
jgi:hypothetical protein